MYLQVGAVSTPTANVSQALEKCDGDANKLDLLVGVGVDVGVDHARDVSSSIGSICTHCLWWILQWQHACNNALESV